jgi:hypothetical protein
MLLYMAATNRVVSIVIMVERKEEAKEYGVHRPVYYVSEAAPGSTRHLEISLAAIRPSCSKEDKVPSSRLQESQLPPEVSGIADSMSDDLAELSADDAA